MNNFPRVFLNAKEEREILQGFPWVFDNEISHLKYRSGGELSEWTTEPLKSSSVDDGSVVEVYTKAGGFLGCGVLNKKSKITVRLLGSVHADSVLENPRDFFEKRIFHAYSIRQLYYSKEDSYRLLFAEADFIPGFICERFCTETGEVFLVVQFLSLLSEVFRAEIIASLKKICRPEGIYERSERSVREKEGLEEQCGWLDKKHFDTNLVIVENGIRLFVDIANGQKTGYFLDQKDNRLAAARFCRGKRVLDAFTHSGAFALNAVKNGAAEVIAADISEDAVALVNKNIQLNDAAKKMTAVCADVFDLLKKYEGENQKFDVIILDPPAFTKSAKMIEKAYGGYKEINLRAMRLLRDGGILITCSCSQFFDSNRFYDMIMHAAQDSHRRIQVLEKRGAGSDHPVLLGYPKSEYLKCAVCRVL